MNETTLNISAIFICQIRSPTRPLESYSRVTKLSTLYSIFSARKHLVYVFISAGGQYGSLKGRSC